LADEAFPCRDCGGAGKVIDSRPYPRYIWRRRECLKCGKKTTTYEYEMLKPIAVRTLREELYRY